MRNILFGRIALILLGGLAGALTLSWSLGQAPPPREIPTNLPAVEIKLPPTSAPAPPVLPVTGKGVSGTQPPAAAFKRRPLAPFDRFRNLESLPDFTRQMVHAAQTGMTWLNRYNQPNGWFWQSATSPP